MQRAYIQSSLDLNQKFYILLLPDLILLPDTLYECIVGIMKLLYDIQEGGNYYFGTYHPHYKEKLVSNPTRTFGRATNCFYFLCNFDNLSAASLLSGNDGAYAALLGLVTKKEEPSRTSSIYKNDTWKERARKAKTPSAFLGSTLLGMRTAIFGCN